MAGASKRTTVGLAVVAIIFIIVIVILCLVPDPCRRLDPRPECRRVDQERREGGPMTTEGTTTSTERSSTTRSTTESTSEPTKRTTTLDETKTDSSTSTSIGSTSSTSMYSTSSTVGSVSTESSSTTSFVDSDPTTVGMTDETTTEMDDLDTTESFTTTSLTKDSTTSSTDAMEDDTTTEAEDDRLITESSTTTIDTTYLTTDLESETNVTDETTTEALYETSTTTIDTETKTTTILEEEDESSTTWMTTTTDAVTTPYESTDMTTTQESTQRSTTTEEGKRTTDVTTAIIPKGDGHVCNTKICKEVARRMLDIMDPSDVNPCEDFYQYSCGGILDDPFLKPEDPQWTAQTLIKEALERGDRNDTDLEALFAVYDSCKRYKIQDTASEDAARAFRDLGYEFTPKSNEKYMVHFPDATYSDTFDLSIALARMMKVHFTPFFDLMIDVDGEDRGSFQLKMTLPAFGSAFSGDYSKAVCSQEYRAKAEESKANGDIFDINSNYVSYVNCTGHGNGLASRLTNMVKAVERLGLLDNLSDEVKTDFLAETKFNTDILLKNIAGVTPSPPEVKKKLRSKDYQIFSVTQISDESVFGKIPIDFKRFIDELMGKNINPDDTMIQVYFKDELKKIFSIINDEYEDQEPVMQNILMLLWTERVFYDLVSPLGPPVGSQDYCFNVVSTLMDDYVSYLYLRELPERDAIQKQIEKMIKLSMAEASSQLDRSNLNCKDDSIMKLDEMTGEVASFDEIRDSFLERKEVITVNESDFLHNYLSLLKNYRGRLYEISNDESPQTVKSMWSVFQFVYKSSGITSYSLNKFLIPYATMNPPLYYEGVPDYINYAGIGHMIAHELMHGFDSTGNKYNFERREKMKTDKALIYPTECLVEQLQQTKFLNSSQGFNVKLKLDEKLAQDEVLADSAAIQLAWKTYERDFQYQRTPTTTTQAPTQPYRAPARRRRRDVYPGEHRRGKSLKPYARPLRMLPTDLRLPHLENFDPLQLYYIKTAQNHCSHTSEVDIIAAMENEHLPNKLRVNIMLGNDPMFIEAFKCPVGSKMIPSQLPSGLRGQCPFSPVGYNVIGQGCLGE